MKTAESAEYVKGEDHLSASLSVCFHAIPRKFDDDKLIVTIEIERITLDEFSEDKASYLRSGQYKSGKEENHKFWFWWYELHPETSLYDMGSYTYYRRDVKINDKEILHAHVEVINAKVPGIEEDHKAVKRILDSIEPLPENHK